VSVLSIKFLYTNEFRRVVAYRARPYHRWRVYRVAACRPRGARPPRLSHTVRTVRRLLKDSGAQGVAYAGASQLAGLQKAADAIGYHPKYVSFYGNLVPAYVKLAGPLAEGTYVDGMQQPPD
jgi:hypothetical protein